jgi:hypothetical protein
MGFHLVAVVGELVKKIVKRQLYVKEEIHKKYKKHRIHEI